MELHISTWSEFKTLLAAKNAKMQCVEKPMSDKTYYHIFFVDGGAHWVHEIVKLGTAPDPSDQKDYEDNYAASCNGSIDHRDANGRLEMTKTSRPDGTLTYFGGGKDTGSQIGDGDPMTWSFNTGESAYSSSTSVTAPTGFSRERIEFSFLDVIYLKEGSIFWENASFGSYGDFYIVCPDGEWYVDNAGTPQQASGDTIVEHYISKMPLMGDCPMGTFLNTESAQAVGMPTNYKAWLEITVPDTNTTCHGGIIAEMYRTRNHVL